MAILAWKFINSLITQKSLHVQSWNLDTTLVLMNTLWKPSLVAPDFVIKILQAEKRQKVYEFEPLYLGSCWYWCKMVCDFWAHIWQPLFWLCSFIQLKYYVFVFLLCFFLTFFFFYLFSSHVIFFQNHWTHCIQTLSDWKYQRGLLRDRNRRCQIGEIPLNQIL